MTKSFRNHHHFFKTHRSWRTLLSFLPASEKREMRRSWHFESYLFRKYSAGGALRDL